MFGLIEPRAGRYGFRDLAAVIIRNLKNQKILAVRAAKNRKHAQRQARLSRYSPALRFVRLFIRPKFPLNAKLLIFMAIPEGLEPPTPCLEGRKYTKSGHI
jgi:hypothetical protein